MHTLVFTFSAQLVKTYSQLKSTREREIKDIIQCLNKFKGFMTFIFLGFIVFDSKIFQIILRQICLFLPLPPKTNMCFDVVLVSKSRLAFGKK